MKVLVDTSVWSLALRRAVCVPGPEVDELKRLIGLHVVEIIGPVRQEILSGVRETAKFEQLESRLGAFPDLPMQTEDFVTAAKMFNLCRSKGIQGSNTDFLICAVAVRNDFAIFTADSDFRLFEKCLPIVIHEVKPRAEPHVVAGGLQAHRRKR